MSEAYFIFNGKDSRDMGIIITESPTITKPQKRMNVVEINGRNGVLHEDLGSYENVTKSIECAVKRRTWEHSFDEISSWLDGGGELIVSVEPDKIYRVMIKNSIPISNVVRSFPKFLIQFDCYPLKYSVNKTEEELTITEPTTVYNDGTYYSEPIITVHGTGNIVLIVNGNNFSLSNVNGYIIINAEIMEVYKDAVNCNNQFSAVGFPRLEVGENRVGFTGNVEKVVIYRNRRWI